MEVVVAEEKKKIFRARKTMKISDRQQLESLHSALSPSVRSSSNSSSPPPLLNGTHKEDVGQKGSDHKEQQSDAGDSKSPLFTPPESPGSPPLALSLSLSPSPPSGPSPRPKEDDPPSSPSSPFHCLNNELKKMEEEGKKKKNGRSPSPLSLEGGAAAGQEVGGAGKAEVAPEKKPGEATGTERKETHATTQDRATDQAKASAPPSPVLPATTSNPKPDKGQGAELQQGDSPAAGKDGARGTEAEAPEASTAAEERSGSPKTTTASPPPGASSPSPSAGPVSGEDMKEEEVKEEEEGDQPEKEETKEEEKMEVDFVKTEMKKEAKKEAKVEGVQSSSSSGSSSTSLSNKGAKEERKSSSGQKRPTSEDGHGVDREGKRPRMDGVELEAQLELKITAKAGSHHKLEKIVQEMVEKRLRGLQLTAFDLSLKDLKDRVEKYDKHQSAINTLQAKIARLAKKFGEANQSSENNKKQEIVTSSVAKTASAINTTPSQRPVRTSMEVKQTLTPVSTHLSASPSQLKPTTTPSTTTSTAMVTQAPILQLITSNATTSTLGSGPHQTQPTGTLLLKTTSRTNMVGQGQPLLIQLHPGLSMNGQGGTLVNIPVSSFAAVSSLNKAKTTTAFILKAAPSTTTTAANAAAIPALQASAAQMSPAQISLARAVYQGGAGGIGTPHAGVSMTTARAPTHSVSVAGLVSSTSSLATSGPAATGSTAPGTPSGTTMTSKTDNQTTPTKTPVQGSRPKSSFIDLTEDDDDVLVTGVKKPTVTSASSLATQRPPGPPPLISTPTGPTARSSPQQSASNPQHTVHHRPPLDSPMKARAGNAGTPNRTTTTTTSAAALPPLPSAPQPPARLPLEAAQTSSPQQPQLKLARVQSQNGIVLSWCVSETDRSCAAVESYHLYAYHMDNSAATGPGLQHWKKIGEVKALPLPMACTLTQFVSGSTYYFAVRARDIYGRFGPFCEPQCTDVISAASS